MVTCAGWDERAPAGEAEQAALAGRRLSSRALTRLAPRQGRRFHSPEVAMWQLVRASLLGYDGHTKAGTHQQVQAQRRCPCLKLSLLLLLEAPLAGPPKGRWSSADPTIWLPR